MIFVCERIDLCIVAIKLTKYNNYKMVFKENKSMRLILSGMMVLLGLFIMPVFTSGQKIDAAKEIIGERII